MAHRQFRDAGIGYMAGVARRLGAKMEGTTPKLQAFVDDVATVDEKYRDLYVEDVDPKTQKKRFRIDAEGVEDVTGLKSTVTGLRTDNRKLKERAKLLDGIDDETEVDKIVELGRAALERQKSGKPNDEVENIRTSMTREREKEVGKLTNQINGMKASLEEALIENAAVVALSEADTKGNSKLLLPHIRGQAGIVEVEGEGDIPRFEARVFEGSGKDRKERLDGKTGKPMTIKALVAEMKTKDDFADAFDGSGASGSGAPPDGGSGMPTPPRRGGDTKPTHKEAKKRAGDYAL
jgi:hypothetical protein